MEGSFAVHDHGDVSFLREFTRLTDDRLKKCMTILKGVLNKD